MQASDGRRVTVTIHGRGDTFTIKTLRSIIESQARWTEDDLKRLSTEEWWRRVYRHAARTGCPINIALFAPARGRNFCARPLFTSAI
jgi:hypothetical protein